MDNVARRKRPPLGTHTRVEYNFAIFLRYLNTILLRLYKVAPILPDRTVPDQPRDVHALACIVPDENHSQSVESTLKNKRQSVTYRISSIN